MLGTRYSYVKIFPQFSNITRVYFNPQMLSYRYFSIGISVMEVRKCVQSNSVVMWFVTPGNNMYRKCISKCRLRIGGHIVVVMAHHREILCLFSSSYLVFLIECDAIITHSISCLITCACGALYSNHDILDRVIRASKWSIFSNMVINMLWQFESAVCDLNLGPE